MSALFGGAISKRAATNLWAPWMWLIINNSINTRWLQLRLCLRLEPAAYEWIYWLWSEGHKWGEAVEEMRTDPSCCPRQGEVRDPRPCLRWLLHLFTSVLVLGKQKSDVFRTASSQDVFEVLYAIIYKFCACSPSQRCSSSILRRISALRGQSLVSQGISYFVWELCSHCSCPLSC